MIQLVEIIHRPCCEHVRTIFLGLNYSSLIALPRRRKYLSTRGRESCAHNRAECKHHPPLLNLTFASSVSLISCYFYYIQEKADTSTADISKIQQLDLD